VRARAPGKLVLSGAYAVLEGAPALVTAVDRFVVADASRDAERATPEVREALGEEQGPWFDAGALREGDAKLGLGSSAAILVASLAARELLRGGSRTDSELVEAVLGPALAAHARAQGGGSGVDVAAAAYGGTLIYRLGPLAPAVVRVALPRAIVIEAWWSGRAAVTSDFVRRVRALREREPGDYAMLLGAQGDAARRAERAVLAGDAAGLVSALHAQRAALAALGRVAAVPIVTLEAERLAAAAAPAAVLPAGAGGGDILLHVGFEPSSVEFRALARGLGHHLLPLALGARGVHAITSVG
jgi:phosphomevalonate kinase